MSLVDRGGLSCPQGGSVHGLLGSLFRAVLAEEVY